MQQIFKFIIKYRYFLLFIFLEFVALFFTIQSHSYHKSKFVNSSNSITGGLYKKMNLVNEFFNLKSENTILSEENAHLKNLLSLTSFGNNTTQLLQIDTSLYYQKYKYTVANIINNNYTKRNNYLTINKGLKQGVHSEMGVVNSKGIIGVTNSVSKNNATIISILNKYSLINVKLKNNDHYGTLYWDGKDYKIVQLLDLPRQTKIKIGDTIITGGKSTLFPEGVLVGTVKDFKVTNDVFQYVNIALFNDMSSLSSVTIITNLEKEEIIKLEATNNE